MGGKLFQSYPFAKLIQTACIVYIINSCSLEPCQNCVESDFRSNRKECIV